MVGVLTALAIAGGLFVFAFVIPYFILEGVPEWVRLPRSKKKHRRQMLEFIEWRRAKDMKRYPTLYPEEADWNERELEHTVRTYDHYDRKRMLEERGETELMQWVLKNDPSVLQSRIQQLEKELEIK